MNLPSVSNTPLITNEVAVSVRNLGLTYTTAIDRRPTLKARLKSLGGKQTRTIRALDDVNLDIEYGQVLGVIGTNGAGKSSLMRVIAGILPPSQGRVEVYGSVSTLLALGVGFNPAMSGRDNVLLGGLAAGMYARLAFSVAATVRPDILIVDEALSTGDAKFKEKSLNRIKELRSEDRALILVSHAMRTLREVCNDIAWLHKGKLIQRGEPNTVIDAYQEFLHLGKSAVVDEDL